MPNYDANADNRYVALGSGGELVVEFVDNVLIDGSGPDLAVFEIGPLVEATKVAISEDEKSWIDVGKAGGGKCTLDIAAFVEAGQWFRIVRLKDDDNGGDGADIDAVGAIHSLAVGRE